MGVLHSKVSGEANPMDGKIGGEDWDAEHLGATARLGSTYAIFSDECYFFSSTQMFDGSIAQGSSGTGAGVTATGAVIANHPGVLQLSCGSTTTGRATMSGPQEVVFGAGRFRCATWFQIRVLSDGTNTFTVRSGWNTSNTGNGTDGIFFRYAHSVNSGKWEAVTRSNGSETAEDTGVTADASTTIGTNMHRFELDVNAAGSNVDFYIDGTKTNDITTTIPTTSARFSAPQPACIVASAGSSTTNRIVFLDAYVYNYEFTTPR